MDRKCVCVQSMFGNRQNDEAHEAIVNLEGRIFERSGRHYCKLELSTHSPFKYYGLMHVLVCDGYVTGTDVARCADYNSQFQSPPHQEHDTSSIPYLKE